MVLRLKEGPVEIVDTPGVTLTRTDAGFWAAVPAGKLPLNELPGFQERTPSRETRTQNAGNSPANVLRRLLPLVQGKWIRRRRRRRTQR